jgi:hypothetical protein
MWNNLTVKELQELTKQSGGNITNNGKYYKKSELLSQLYQQSGGGNIDQISYKDLYNLDWRIDGMPRSFMKKQNAEDCDYVVKQTMPGVFTFNANQYAKSDNCKNTKYAYKTSPYLDSVINFDSPAKILQFRFNDNPVHKKFTLTQPITLHQFVDAVRKHYDNVGLVGAPDNGMFDGIKKIDSTHFNILTAS